mgnify:CR=1 FL=1
MCFPAKEVTIKDESNIEEYDIELSCGAGVLSIAQEHDCIVFTVEEATHLHNFLSKIERVTKDVDKPERLYYVDRINMISIMLRGGIISISEPDDVVNMTLAEATNLHKELGDMLELIKQSETKAG